MSTAERWVEKRPYIRMFSGRKFFFDEPEFHVDDIARHTAGINRYTGGSRISVAQHCVVAAEMAARFYPDNALLPARMLIHDAGEAYLGDVASPLKSLLGDYRAIEETVEVAIEKFFDLTFIGDALVKEVDNRMWLTETLVLHGGNVDYSGPLEAFPLTHPELVDSFTPWGAAAAELRWLEAYRRLLPWCQ